MPETVHPRAPRGVGKLTKEQMSGIPAGLWQKCPKCGALLYVKELERNLRVCHHCQHHFRLSANERIALLTDADSFSELDADLIAGNPLDFPDYADKLASDRAKTGRAEAFLYGDATLEGVPFVFGLADFAFRGGSMGAALRREGRPCTGARRGPRSCPVVLVTTSGGARMQEGIISLMQMAKTAAASERLKATGQLYLVIMTDPTTAGVLASFASLGDIIIAELRSADRLCRSRVSSSRI